MANSSAHRPLLLTGFQPFGGQSINPSGLLAESFQNQVIGRHVVHAMALPTVFDEAPRRLRAAMRELRPDLVVCLGQAGGRACISFERVAINIDEANIADNAGQQPAGTAIARRGPAAYWSTLPIHAMADACEQAGVPASVSNTAGTFVCNHVFYSLMRTLAHARWQGVRGGFVHVPFLPEQGHPSLAWQDMRRGLQAALTVAVEAYAPQPDRRKRGSTH